jgi:single-stranded DNA-binding protein
MEVLGNVKVVGADVQVNPTFKKRELVVTTDETYPQHIMIEFTQDKCDLLNNFAIGDAVRVSINLRGREWQSPQGETRYFNSIQGWRIEKNVEGGSAAPSAPSYAAPTATAAPAAAPTPVPTALEGEDDLPF